MNGHFASGLLLERFRAPADAAGDYGARRGRMLLAPGGWAARLLFASREADEWVALYDLERWDIEDLPASPEGWSAVALGFPELVMLQSQIFRRCGPPDRPSRTAFTTPSTGVSPQTVVIAPATCEARSDRAAFMSADRAEWDFNRWCNRRLVPAAMSAGGFDTAYRYVDTALEHDQTLRRFLAIYESARPVKEVGARMQSWTERVAPPTGACLLPEMLYRVVPSR